MQQHRHTTRSWIPLLLRMSETWDPEIHSCRRTPNMPGIRCAAIHNTCVQCVEGADTAVTQDMQTQTSTAHRISRDAIGYPETPLSAVMVQHPQHDSSSIGSSGVSNTQQARRAVRYICRRWIACHNHRWQCWQRYPGMMVLSPAETDSRICTNISNGSGGITHSSHAHRQTAVFMV